MSKITFEPTGRQYEALQYLLDDKTTEILYGGSAGGGKTLLGCVWIIMSALKYPGTRWVIARSRLSILKITTIKTFQDIIKMWGLDNHVEFHLFNNNITFKNGSEVLLLDLFLYPQDPDFNKLGSLELTGALIDEGAEITEKAFNILTSRFRYKLKEYNLIPKILIVSNPTRNFLYNNFYKLSKDNKLPEWRKFVRALPLDNPHLPPEYIENLKRLPLIDRKRLYEGEWEFQSDDYDLFNIDNLYQTFYNQQNKGGEKYLTCDVASTGSDRTVITIWEGLSCIKIIKYKNYNTSQIVNTIKEYLKIYSIPIGNVIVDSIGVGVGVSDLLPGSNKFIANSRPFNNEPFNHIKSQLFFKFAEIVNKGLVSISYDESPDDIIDEIISHKRYKADIDGKFQITPKEIVKLNISRSPDIADALMMRFFYEYKPRLSFTFL